MKDDELIGALVGDLKPVSRESGVGRPLAVFLSWSALCLLVFTRGGTAISLALHPFNLSVLLIILGAAAAGAIVSSIPGRPAWRPALIVAAVALLAWAAVAAIRCASAWQVPAVLWGDVPWPKCFGFTLAFAAIPTFVLVRIVNRGWPVHPHATGALTFIAGAAAGALIVSLECPSHAPLHVLLGHTLPIVGAAAIGMSLGRRTAQPAGSGST